MSTEDEPHLISAMQATMAATARPCTRAGWSLPVDSVFSMTDTHPMNTKNVVPTSSPRQGWNTRSNLLGGLAEGALASEDTRDVPTSPISIFSSAMSRQWGLAVQAEDVTLSAQPWSVSANHKDFGV